MSVHAYHVFGGTVPALTQSVPPNYPDSIMAALMQLHYTILCYHYEHSKMQLFTVRPTHLNTVNECFVDWQVRGKAGAGWSADHPEF